MSVETKVRVLVIGTARTMRAELVELFRDDDEFDVVGEFGPDANLPAICAESRPELIVLDTERLDAAARIVETIMTRCALPILAVSPPATLDESHRALFPLGVVELLPMSRHRAADELLETAKTVATIRVTTRRRIPPTASGPGPHRR